MPVPAPVPAFLSSSTVPLHRVRFFDHTPSPITALAFSPTPLPAPSDPAAKGKAKALNHAAANELGVLVLARENGEVEIWEHVEPEGNSMGNWVLEKVCHETFSND
jgi:U3 small nucleolar RNA-associated protein 4